MKGKTTMKLVLRRCVAALLALALSLPAAALAQSFSGDQRLDIERIIKEYLLTNPALLQDIMNELEKRQATAAAEKPRSSDKEHRAALFTSPHLVTLAK